MKRRIAQSAREISNRHGRATLDPAAEHFDPQAEQRDPRFGELDRLVAAELARDRARLEKHRRAIARNRVIRAQQTAAASGGGQ